jgi:hypothetical protein
MPHHQPGHGPQPTQQRSGGASRSQQYPYHNRRCPRRIGTMDQTQTETSTLVEPPTQQHMMLSNPGRPLISQKLNRPPTTVRRQNDTKPIAHRSPDRKRKILDYTPTIYRPTNHLEITPPFQHQQQTSTTIGWSHGLPGKMRQPTQYTFPTTDRQPPPTTSQLRQTPHHACIPLHPCHPNRGQHCDTTPELHLLLRP